MIGFLTAIEDVRHFAQIDRTPAEHTDDHIAHIVCGFQKGTRLHKDFAVGGGEAASAVLPVRLLQHRHNARRTEAAGSQPNGIEDHANGLASPANERGLCH